MNVLTRTNWNELVTRVNDKIIECESTEAPLHLAEEAHAWKVSDVTDMRDKLNAVCTDEYEFEEELTRWRQAIIDELDTAICECWPGGYVMTLPLLTSSTEHNEGDPTDDFDCHSCSCVGTYSWSDLTTATWGFPEGELVGPPGYYNRAWCVIKYETYHHTYYHSDPCPWDISDTTLIRDPIVVAYSGLSTCITVDGTLPPEFNVYNYTYQYAERGGWRKSRIYPPFTGVEVCGGEWFEQTLTERDLSYVIAVGEGHEIISFIAAITGQDYSSTVLRSIPKITSKAPEE